MKNTALVTCLLALTAAYGPSHAATGSSFPEAESGYIQVDGGRLFYEIAGQGTNIVLLHDGMLPSGVWDEQFPVLAKSYRVTRYDRRAYGKSSDPKAPFSEIEDLNQIFIQLKIEKAIVFGMSSGGGLAIDFALKHPSKVMALILVGAVVNGYSYSSHMMTRGGHMPSTAELSDPRKVIRYFGWEDPYEIFAENVKAKEKFVKILEAHLHETTGDFYIPADRPGARFLAEIKVPTLVLVGEHDIPDVHAHAGVIHFGIPGARREIVLKSGHLVPLEQPAAFNAAVARFLAGMRS